MPNTTPPPLFTGAYHIQELELGLQTFTMWPKTFLLKDRETLATAVGRLLPTPSHPTPKRRRKTINGNYSTNKTCRVYHRVSHPRDNKHRVKGRRGKRRRNEGEREGGRRRRRRKRRIGRTSRTRRRRKRRRRRIGRSWKERSRSPATLEVGRQGPREVAGSRGWRDSGKSRKVDPGGLLGPGAGCDSGGGRCCGGCRGCSGSRCDGRCRRSRGGGGGGSGPAPAGPAAAAAAAGPPTSAAAAAVAAAGRPPLLHAVGEEAGDDGYWPDEGGHAPHDDDQGHEAGHQRGLDGLAVQPPAGLALELLEAEIQAAEIQRLPLPPELARLGRGVGGQRCRSCSSSRRSGGGGGCGGGGGGRGRAGTGTGAGAGGRRSGSRRRRRRRSRSRGSRSSPPETTQPVPPDPAAANTEAQVLLGAPGRQPQVIDDERRAHPVEGGGEEGAAVAVGGEEQQVALEAQRPAPANQQGAQHLALHTDVAVRLLVLMLLLRLLLLLLRRLLLLVVVVPTAPLRRLRAPLLLLVRRGASGGGGGGGGGGQGRGGGSRGGFRGGSARGGGGGRGSCRVGVRRRGRVASFRGFLATWVSRFSRVFRVLVNLGRLQVKLHSSGGGFGIGGRRRGGGGGVEWRQEEARFVLPPSGRGPAPDRQPEGCDQQQPPEQQQHETDLAPRRGRRRRRRRRRLHGAGGRRWDEGRRSGRSLPAAEKPKEQVEVEDKKEVEDEKPKEQVEVEEKEGEEEEEESFGHSL
ncbi:uncharacterized protein LOC130454659 [Monodelphis domestica]|uniref:uncharacterized protein LOC130454659 n=1 Tax=Monodelphis domestica TaxID=13616 RepID=UPI0024E1DA56|nr:uncharacterized protein LOC130454659 [Monodelphis domestica]